MNREIKFRAWKESTQEMISWYGLLNDYSGKLSDILSATHLNNVMQYTGLKDKNGVEIYESDVCIYKDSEERHVITYFEGSFVLGRPLTLNGLIHFNTPKTFTVIGNIHENPELLGGE